MAVSRLHIKPHCMEPFLNALHDVLPQSAAEEGLLRYEWLQSRSDPTQFTFVDLFRDEAAYQSHIATSHIARFAAAVMDYVASPPISEAYLIREIFDAGSSPA